MEVRVGDCDVSGPRRICLLNSELNFSVSTRVIVVIRRCCWFGIQPSSAEVEGKLVLYCDRVVVCASAGKVAAS